MSYIFNFKDESLVLFINVFFNIKEINNNFKFGGIFNSISLNVYKYFYNNQLFKVNLLLEKYDFINGGCRKNLLDISELIYDNGTYMHYSDFPYKKTENLLDLLKKKYSKIKEQDNEIVIEL